MASGIRITVGRRSRESGTPVGVTVNTFGLDKLIALTGQDLLPICVESLQGSFDQAVAEWPVLTGASRDSIAIVPMEVGERHCRVALQVGGEELINDPRNTKHVDYAPYLEFNGSPSGSSAPGVIRNAIYDRDAEIRVAQREGVKRLIEEALS